jgi:ribosomal protein L44E
MALLFKYKKDKQYFVDLIADGNTTVLEKKYSNLFDFRSLSVKRAEYNAHKQELFNILFKRANGICQICKSAKGVEIDHIVPLASNQLNKKLRKMRPIKINGKLRKVPSESYGSNKLVNLQLACRPCNRKKWHNF